MQRSIRRILGVSWLEPATLLILLTLGLMERAEATAADRRPAVTITATPSAEGLRLTVKLDREVRSFAFESDTSTVRDESWSVTTPGLSLSGDLVSGRAPFRRFEMLVRPLRGERDAIYPAVFRVGSGLVVYTPYLRGALNRYRTILRLTPSGGNVAVPAQAARREGFVYLGPPGLLQRQGAFETIIAPGTPPELVSSITAHLRAGSAYFQEQLGSRPRYPGIVIVAFDPVGIGSVVADVARGGIIAYRFHGAQWREPNALAAQHVRRLVLHEAFHLWNGELATPADGTPSWLHEGGAEYAALQAEAAIGLPDEKAAERLTDALAQCRMALGPESLLGTKRSDMRLRYPCGMVLQWIVDLGVRRSSGGTRTVLDVWGEMIRTAPAGRYALEDFWSAAGIADPAVASRPLRLLLSRTGDERWTDLPDAFAEIGARVRMAARPQDYRAAAIFHILNTNCTAAEKDGRPESIGFSETSGVLQLDTHRGCGILAGEPIVETLEGHDLLRAPQAAFEAVRERCAAKQPVTFRGAGTALAVPCGNSPADPAPVLVVERHLPS